MCSGMACDTAIKCDCTIVRFSADSGRRSRVISSAPRKEIPMVRTIVTMLLLVSITVQARAQQLHKCVDAKGQASYQSAPPTRGLDAGCDARAFNQPRTHDTDAPAAGKRPSSFNADVGYASGAQARRLRHRCFPARVFQQEPQRLPGRQGPAGSQAQGRRNEPKFQPAAPARRNGLGCMQIVTGGLACFLSLYLVKFDGRVRVTTRGYLKVDKTFIDAKKRLHVWPTGSPGR